MEFFNGFYPIGLILLWGVALLPVVLTSAVFVLPGGSAPEWRPTLIWRESASFASGAISI